MEGKETYGISRRGFLGVATGLAAGAILGGRSALAQEAGEVARIRQAKADEWKKILSSTDTGKLRRELGYTGEYGGRVDFIAVEVNGRNVDTSLPIAVVEPGAPLEVVLRAAVLNPHGKKAAYPFGWVHRNMYGGANLRPENLEERAKKPVDAPDKREYSIWTPDTLRAPTAEGTYFFWAVAGPHREVTAEEKDGQKTTYPGFDFVRTGVRWSSWVDGSGDCLVPKDDTENKRGVKNWDNDEAAQALHEGYAVAPILKDRRGNTEPGTFAAKPVIMVVKKLKKGESVVR